MRKRRKLNIVLILFVVILLFGLGYAYLTTTLSINGTTDVESNTWNVYWDNIQVSSGSVTGTQVITQPTIDTNKTAVSFHVNLKQPRDFYEFTVDAKNIGSIDAMIDTITKTTSIPNYLNYTVTYDDDIELTEKQLLKANSTEKYKVRVEYRSDIDVIELPSTPESISLTFGLSYSQADSSAKTIGKEIFTTSNVKIYVGQQIPNDAMIYDSYQDTIEAFRHPFFIKHVIHNNIVMESYAGFVKDNQVYYLKAGGSTWNSDTTSYNDDSIYFDQNKSVLESAFEPSKCLILDTSVSCSINGTVAGYAWKNGNVETSTGYYGRCYALNDGSSYCE